VSTPQPISNQEAVPNPIQGTDDQEIQPPTHEEFNDTIQKLNNNKAAGSHNIILEFLKHGSYVLKKRLYNLICKIWNNEKIPIEWSKGIICPILKKSDPKNCGNYRGITLLNISYKIFAILIYNKLRGLNQRLVIVKWDLGI
jgi:hypothetical protein